MLEALLVTLPKAGKTPDVPQNFRTISLLKNDLKIDARMLALHLMDILPTLIDPNQPCFTKGRQTSDTTRQLIDIIHLVIKQWAPSLLLALEAEKAFNRVHWQCLTNVLERFGFSGHMPFTLSHQPGCIHLA